MRGFRSVLVERVDLGQGTTGRFHGLLHSGGRYVTSDPRSATECAAVLDVSTRLQLATAASCQPARELLLRIVSMLINMGRALHA